MTSVGEVLAIRLRLERKRNGWSQIYIAAQLDLGRNTTYSSWERARKKPNAETIVQLADLFNVSTDYLLGRTDQRELSEPSIRYKEISIDL
jgi:transcriptional regulator with XRE-family HTH domain